MNFPRQVLDAVVVGSGFGGAVCACRLAEKGLSVCVLERGRRWAAEDFPRLDQANAPFWFQNNKTGLFEVRRFAGMRVVVVAGVGGGSLAYTNVQKVPSSSVFEAWPEPIRLDFLRPFYDRVQEMLEPSPIPVDLQRIRAFRSAHSKIPAPRRVELPLLAIRWAQDPASQDEARPNRFGALQKPCNLCGQCVLGCTRHAKNTLDLTYLKRAETLGARIYPLYRVTRLVPLDSGKQGYAVHVLSTEEEVSNQALRHESKIIARRVFLAAGSLGSTELLLRCRDVDGTLPYLSPRLGYGWSANGDLFAGMLDSNMPIHPTVGPSVAAAFDAQQSEGFYALEGAIPTAMLARRRNLISVLTRLVHAFRFRAHWPKSATMPDSADAAPPFEEECASEEMDSLLRNMGLFFLMGRDSSDGRLRLTREGTPELQWESGASAELLERMRKYLRQLGHAYGGWMLEPSRWRGKSGMTTVHPLGGCGMGQNSAAGVVDPWGRVFNYPNLYVCDGSIFPRAIGVPPSMTIAALAEHIAEHVS